MDTLTIVTSCGGYGCYLSAWADSIVALKTRPAFVHIFTHGSTEDRTYGAQALEILTRAGFNATHEHETALLDFGTARNRAVALSHTEWVMHLDCDDRIMPHAVDDIIALAPDADVISFGYERAGDTKFRPLNKVRLYRSGNGLEILNHMAPCSGVSPFKRTLWEQSPYRTDMRGAWDTALWIGFARLGARFRATKRPCFWYWHHPDSIYTRRRLTKDWTQAITGAQLKSLRRDDHGVAVIVPLDKTLDESRKKAWTAVKEHLTHFHPDWQIVEGHCRSAEWCKGDAIDDALSRTNADVIVVMDSDCLVPKEALDWAVSQVQAGAPWAIPHGEVSRLTPSATDAYLSRSVEGRLASPAEDCLQRDRYMGYAGGGIFVVRHVHYDAVGGIPYIFRGWGSEDQALAVLLDTLIGPHVRGAWELIHLWHTPQTTKSHPGIVSQNHRRFNFLRCKAKEGQESLWQAVLSLPAAPRSKHMHPWKKKAAVVPPKQTHGVTLHSRHSYLARKAQPNPKKPGGGK